MTQIIKTAIDQKMAWAAAFVAMSHSAIGAANKTGDVAPLVIGNGAGWEFVLENPEAEPIAMALRSGGTSPG